MATKSCEPSEADWYAEVAYGRSFCPLHGAFCRRADCERAFGTETDENSGYFKGDRPGREDRRALVPGGFYVIESTVRRLHKR